MDLLRKLAAGCAITVFLAFFGTVFGTISIIVWAEPGVLKAAGWALKTLFEISPLLLTLSVAIPFYNWVKEKQHQRNVDRLTAQDGSFLLQEYHMRDGTLVVKDPNRMPGSAYAFHPDAGVIDVSMNVSETAVVELNKLWHAVRGMQAAHPSDHAIMNSPHPVNPPKVEGGIKALTGGKPLPLPDSEPEAHTPAPVLIPDAVTAIQQSQPTAWTVGQSPESGKLALFDPVRQTHAAIIGATGTGKTKSVGFMLAIQAIRHQYHTVIFDPEFGADWGPFAPYAEHHETDRTTFGNQVESLYVDFANRTGTGNHRPLFVIIEEYGALIRQIEIANNSAAKTVNDRLDEMLRLGRKRNVHLCFVDQYPEHWSPQVIAGTKFKAVFQLGPNQGNKVQEYHAGKLADRGEFLVNGVQYNSWAADHQLTNLFAGLPSLNGYRVVQPGSMLNTPPNPAEPGHRTPLPERIEPDRTHRTDRTPLPSTAQTPPPVPPFAVRSADKRRSIRWYMDEIGGSQADCRRWLAEHGVEVSKGYVSDTYNGKYASADADVEVVEDAPAQLEVVEDAGKGKKSAKVAENQKPIKIDLNTEDGVSAVEQLVEAGLLPADNITNNSKSKVRL